MEAFEGLLGHSEAGSRFYEIDPTFRGCVYSIGTASNHIRGRLAARSRHKTGQGQA